MNIYQETINALPDEELKAAVREMKEFDDSDILPVGTLLRVLNTLQNNTGHRQETVLGTTRCALYERAALKWAES